MLESEVVRHSEQPAAKIGSRPAELHVPEERQKHILYNVFGIGGIDPERPYVPQQRCTALVKQREYLGFDVRLAAGFDLDDCGEDESRIGLRHRVRRFYTEAGSQKLREQMRAPENTWLENIL
jgi:hypothetical protein